MVGTNCATMPVHIASGSQYGMPMTAKTMPVQTLLSRARTTRAPT